MLSHFHPPKTKSPSQYRQIAPIPTTISISGGRNRAGRVKTSPKRARTVKDVGVTPGTTGQSFVRLGGGKFRPSGCGGHKNSENAATFPKFLGRRTNFPPHRQLSDTSPGNHDPYCNISTLQISGSCAISTLPRQNHPPNTGKSPQYRPQFPSRKGATAPGGRKCRTP